MGEAICPECGYHVGLGTWRDPGSCPRCDVPLLLTAEMRALQPEDPRADAERRGAQAAQQI